MIHRSADWAMRKLRSCCEGRVRNTSENQRRTPATLATKGGLTETARALSSGLKAGARHRCYRGSALRRAVVIKAAHQSDFGIPLTNENSPASKASARSRIVPCTSGLPPAQWTSWAGAFRRTMKSWLAASSRTATNSVWAWLFCGCFGLRLTASPAAITSRLLHRPFEPLAKSWRLFSLGRDYGTGMSETASRPLALSLAGSSLMKRNLVWVEVAVNVTENCFQT